MSVTMSAVLETFRTFFWVVILIILAIVGFAGIILCLMLRCKKRLQYDGVIPEDEALLQDRLELDRKQQKESDKSIATITGQHFLKGSSRYSLVKTLKNIGSRNEKYWFIVFDKVTKTNRLMSMSRVPPNCPMQCSSSTKWALLELFLSLQHPYIYPTLDVDLKSVSDKDYLVIVMPFNKQGSLKDVVYNSYCEDDWNEKYQLQSDGLSESEVKRLGRQILEALLFFQKKGLIPLGHLSLGNVMFQNGTARLTGLENALLAYVPRVHNRIFKHLFDSPDAVDAICFGHLLFEMTTGYELAAAHPSESDYYELRKSPQTVAVLKFIFDNSANSYPSIQNIAHHAFFAKIDLRELLAQPSPATLHVKLSFSACKMLKEIQRFYMANRHLQKSMSASDLEASKKVEKKENIKEAPNRPVSTLPSYHSATDLSANCKQGEPIPVLSPSQLPYLQLDSHDGSCHTVASFSTSNSFDYFTPPNTPPSARSRFWVGFRQLIWGLRPTPPEVVNNIRI